MPDRSDNEEQDGSVKPLAERADDGFLRIVRSAGGAVRFVEEGSVRGVARIARTFRRGSRPAGEEPSEEHRGAAVDRPPPPAAAAGTARTEGFAASGAGHLGLSPRVAGPPADLRTAQAKPERPWPSSQIDASTLLKHHPLCHDLPTKEVRAHLDDLLQGTETAHHAAREALVAMGRPIAEPLFVATLRNASPELAESALEGLASLQSRRLRGCIAAVIPSHNPLMRLAALRVAQRLRGDAARPFFVHAVLDSSPEVRRRAILYLSWRDSDWSSAALRALCSDPESSVKWAAYRAWATWRPEEVRQLLAGEQESVNPAYCRLMNRLIGDAPPPGAAAETEADLPAGSSRVSGIAPPPLAQKGEASSLPAAPASDSAPPISDGEPAAAAAGARTQKGEASSLSPGSDVPVEATVKRPSSRADRRGRSRKK